MIDPLTILLTITLLGILLVKADNVFNDKRRFDKVGIALFLGIAIMVYGLFNFHFLASISYQETSTIVDGSDTITVTTSNNVYEYNLPFTYLFNGLIFIIFCLSFVEAVMLFFPKTRSRFSAKNKNKYIKV